MLLYAFRVIFPTESKKIKSFLQSIGAKEYQPKTKNNQELTPKDKYPAPSEQLSAAQKTVPPGFAKPPDLSF